MSYYQDGGSIIHLPASTHVGYSARYSATNNNNNNASTSNYSSYGATVLNNYSSHGVVAAATDSGNLSLESRDSLLEAGELVLTTQTNRRKPDVGVIVSIIAFLVWLRLFQAMFYSSVLGNLEGFVKELLFVLLVWIPSITLTCFYFRSDDFQHRFRRT